jgi:hypothetical protein
MGLHIHKYHKYCYFTIAIEFQVKAIKKLNDHKNKVIDLKEKSINSNEEVKAKILLGIELLIEALINELKMWIALKNDKTDIAWDLLANAENCAISAYKSCDLTLKMNSDDLDYIRKLYSIEDIIFPHQIFVSPTFIVENLECGNAVLLSKEELSENYPGVWVYLLSNRKTLESRERGKWKHDRWYALGRNQNLNQMEQIKILTPSIASSASFTLDETEFYYFVGSGGGGGGGYGITLINDDLSEYKYILGLLNSKLLDFYLKSYSSTFRGGYFAYNRQYIEKLPIRTVNFDNTNDLAMHDRMVALVEHMLQLQKELTVLKTPDAEQRIQRQLDATDKQIDKLVYKLYNLTDEEIKIVKDS